MYIYQELASRAAAGDPVRVGLIGAGKFGSMFLSQVPTTPGLEVAVIADAPSAIAISFNLSTYVMCLPKSVARTALTMVRLARA